MQLAHGAQVLGVRIWPARDYTRLTIEHERELRFSHAVLRDGRPRLVVDIEGMDLTPRLKELVGQVAPNDPYVAAVRVTQWRPGVVRLTVDLKEEIKPQVFALPPVGPYGMRLVLDLYPAVPVDPLLALLRDEHARRDDIGRLLEQESRRAPGPGRPGDPALSRLVTIAIDPGHGGEDPGAVGRAGTFEKDVTLSIARRLHELIESEPALRAALTRDGDYFVPLGRRVAKARAVHADLFVSIHADAWINPDARGSSVFALSDGGASSAAAAWMARRENDADSIGGINLGAQDAQVARVLLDLSTTAQINQSLKFGNALLRELERVNRLHKPRVEQAGFAVLKAPDIPSVLVETAFISNPEEEARLRDETYQDEMARAMLRGIQRHFARHPPQARQPIA
jgi:N-acetylmuramoyl-L-alanine amidase